MRRALLALTLLALPLPARAAPDAAEVRVRQLLLAHHGVPDAAAWRKAGPEAPQILRRLAAAPTAGPWYQDRALDALAALPSPETQAVLQALLADPEARPAARGRAVSSLVVAFGDAAVPEASRRLDDPAPEVRGAAVAALARAGTPPARAALDAARRRARHPDVVEAVERLSGARGAP
jgi:HEAT repeat protein